MFELVDRYEIVLSHYVQMELLKVLGSGTLERNVSGGASISKDEVVAILSSAAVITPGSESLFGTPDRVDRLMECALTGAEYLISDDTDILRVGEYRGIKVASAAAFIALLL